MGKIFDDDGKVRDRDALLSITIGGRTTSKTTDLSTERASITRVEDDHGSTLNIQPRTVDFDLVERIGD